jgi:hypothetical protein
VSAVFRQHGGLSSGRNFIVQGLNMPPDISLVKVSVSSFAGGRLMFQGVILSFA